MNFDELDDIAMAIANEVDDFKNNIDKCYRLATEKYKCDRFHAKMVVNILKNDY